MILNGCLLHLIVPDPNQGLLNDGNTPTELADYPWVKGFFIGSSPVHYQVRIIFHDVVINGFILEVARSLNLE